jgi:hypothetical protein
MLVHLRIEEDRFIQLMVPRAFHVLHRNLLLLTGALPETFDVAVTMGCGDYCPNLKATHREDWQIPDPKAMPPEEFREVRDLIGRKVNELCQCHNPVRQGDVDSSTNQGIIGASIRSSHLARCAVSFQTSYRTSCNESEEGCPIRLRDQRIQTLRQGGLHRNADNRQNLRIQRDAFRLPSSSTYAWVDFVREKWSIRPPPPREEGWGGRRGGVLGSVVLHEIIGTIAIFAEV